jgi:hypothetical protein
MLKFSEFLQDVRRGMTEAELTEALGELATEVSKTGKAGTITYTLKLSAGAEGQIIVDDAIKVATPLPNRASTLFYLADEGLSRRDPRQLSLADLRDTERG